MSGVLCIAVALAFLGIEVSICRLGKRIGALPEEKKGSALRHLSPHRRRVDEKRRINR